jgi:hypothetical protein
MAEIRQEIDKEISDFKKGRHAVKVRERMDARDEEAEKLGRRHPRKNRDLVIIYIPSRMRRVT